MEEEQIDTILSREYKRYLKPNREKYDSASKKIMLFSEAAGGNGDISDPWSDGEDTYFKIMKEIDQYAENIASNLLEKHTLR